MSFWPFSVVSVSVMGHGITPGAQDSWVHNTPFFIFFQ